MRKHAARRSRSTAVFAGLLLLSALGFVLPRSWTDPVRALVHLLIPFQHAATVATDALSDRGVDPDSPKGQQGNGEEAGAREPLEHRAAALSLRVQELEDEVRLLTATRRWEVDGKRMGGAGQLIPARVVAGDIIPWRDSVLLNSGRLQGLRPGAIVVTDRFEIDRGEALGLHEGMAILLGEFVLGWIDELHAQAARVKCLSDPSVEMKVRIGRVTNTGFLCAEGYFWMIGRGRGLMEIREVDRRLAIDGDVAVGDVVVSDPASPLLPFPMVVGRVTEISSNRENPLFSLLSVRSAPEGAPPRRVYVFDPEQGDGGE